MSGLLEKGKEFLNQGGNSQQNAGGMGGGQQEDYVDKGMYSQYIV
jgi:hypothetical protein